LKEDKDREEKMLKLKMSNALKGLKSKETAEQKEQRMKENKAAMRE